MTSERKLRVGSTFSGVGGADLGLERAGFELAWTCEWDEWKRSILQAHWPDVPHYEDIRDLTDPDPVDLLCGGFPCQDLSVAGKRRGFDGERSVLAFEFLRIAESLRPRWLLMENVPGLLSSNGGRDLARLLDELGACDYGWAVRILDARYFGVPQRRRRVFICARRADSELDTRAAAGLALRALWEGSGGDPTPGWPPREITPTRAGAGAAVGSGIAGSLTKRYGKGVNTTCDDGAMVAFRKSKRAASDQDDETWVDDGAANTLNAFDAGDTRTTHAVVDTASTLQASAGKGAGWRIDAEGAAGGHLIPVQNTVIGRADTSGPGGRGHGDKDGPMFTLDRSGPHAIGGVFPVQDGRAIAKEQNGLGLGSDGDPSYTLDRTGAQSVAQAFTQNQREELRDLGDQSGTLTGQGTHQQTYLREQMSVRRLTPIECERLMGWPDNWTAPEGIKAPDSKRYAACGDGIVSWVAYWIGMRIQMIENEDA